MGERRRGHLVVIKPEDEHIRLLLGEHGAQMVFDETRHELRRPQHRLPPGRCLQRGRERGGRGRRGRGVGGWGF